MKITRTITYYNYHFGTVSGNTIAEVGNIVSPVKIGERAMKKIRVQNKIPENAIMYLVEEINEKRGMSIETFIANSDVIPENGDAE